MNHQRMEKYDVTLFHFQVHSWDINIIIVLNAKIGFVDLSLPLRIDVSQQFAFMGLRVDI